MGDGMDLDDFLKGESGGARARLKMGDWKKVGNLIVFLHLQRSAKKPKIAWTRWLHPFNTLAVKKDKDGEDVEYLKYTPFVSPDADVVNQKQHFRDDNGLLTQAPPLLDPFLLLREWLRQEIDEGRMKTDEVIFEFRNPQEDDRVTRWKAGHLSRLEDRKGKTTWSHSLDSKLEYSFVVVQADAPAKGAYIATVPKSLGDAMREEINNQIESNGRDGGNPFKEPYAFKWTYDKDKPFAKQYGAARFNRAELTDDIREAIESSDFPDPSRDCKPRPGDKARIRAAFEQHAQIDLPWDLLFVDDWKDDTQPGTEFDPSQFSDDDEEEGRPRDVSTEKQATSKREKPGAGPKTRRRKRKDAKPKWWVEPDERIDCDECGFPCNPGWAKCPSCNAEYEIDDGDEVEVPTMAALKKAGWKTEEKPKRSRKKKKEEEKVEEKEAAEEDEKCWSCGAELDPKSDKCPECGIEHGDDLPY